MLYEKKISSVLLPMTYENWKFSTPYGKAKQMWQSTNKVQYTLVSNIKRTHLNTFFIRLMYEGAYTST
jgi:hypothetical protein